MLHPIVSREGVLHMKLSGVVDRNDLVALFEQTKALERDVAVIPNRILDSSEVTSFDRGYLDFVDLIAARTKQIFPNCFRTALVAPSPLQYGCARMFQTMNNNPQIDIQIFQTETEALVWVREAASEVTKPLPKRAYI